MIILIYRYNSINNKWSNVIKYWNEITKKWPDKLWSVDFNNVDVNKEELYPCQWFDACKQEICRRNDTKDLRPITCNLTESLDNTIIKSIKQRSCEEAKQILLQ